MSNIIEGFGRRHHKNEFIQFLTYAIASCDETKGHLEKSLDKPAFDNLNRRYEELGAKLYKFRQAVIERHNAFEEGRS